MDTKCLPYGPKYTITPCRDSRIIQTPGLLAILNDDLTHREIFHGWAATGEESEPFLDGYSVGHWEGHTLVVESNGYGDKTWMDGTRHPHSERLRVTERYQGKQKLDALSEATLSLTGTIYEFIRDGQLSSVNHSTFVRPRGPN